MTSLMVSFLPVSAKKNGVVFLPLLQACEKPQAELDRIQSIAGGDNEMKNVAYKSLNSKDTIRTLSSCMERDDWAHCPFENIPISAVCQISSEPQILQYV